METNHSPQEARKHRVAPAPSHRLLIEDANKGEKAPAMVRCPQGVQEQGPPEGYSAKGQREGRGALLSGWSWDECPWGTIMVGKAGEMLRTSWTQAQGVRAGPVHAVDCI